jgi:hypothetical protein
MSSRFAAVSGVIVCRAIATEAFERLWRHTFPRPSVRLTGSSEVRLGAVLR